MKPGAIRVITLTQPWASLVAHGLKRFETRSWATAYRGPLAIHAAKGFPRECRDLCSTEPFAEALTSISIARFDQLPRGAVLATVMLCGCFEMGSLLAPCTADLLASFKVPTWPESAFGDFMRGRFAWYLDHLERLAEPIPAKGALGLWEWKP